MTRPDIAKWTAQDNWQQLLPPSRPSVDHLAFFCKHLEIVPRDIPVAVMGSTPEFCDLLFSLGFQKIHVVDNSAVFYNRMKILRLHNCTDRFIESDWFGHFSSVTQTYGAILSDLTLGNIAYDERSDLYRVIAKSLRKDGLFLTKVLTNETGLTAVEELVPKYQTLPFNIQTINDFSCDFYFTSTLTLIRAISVFVFVVAKRP